MGTDKVDDAMLQRARDSYYGNWPMPRSIAEDKWPKSSLMLDANRPQLDKLLRTLLNDALSAVLVATSCSDDNGCGPHIGCKQSGHLYETTDNVWFVCSVCEHKSLGAVHSAGVNWAPRQPPTPCERCGSVGAVVCTVEDCQSLTASPSITPTEDLTRE